MTAFTLLPVLSQAAILLLLLCLLLLNFCILAAGMERARWQKRGLAALLPMLLCGVLLVLLTAWGKAVEYGEEPHPAAVFFAGLPVAAYLLFLLFGGSLALYLLHGERQHRKGVITRASIKESADNLPAGLCFATEIGIVLSANKVMESLCHRVTGRDLQDAEAFWHTLTGSELLGSAQRVSAGESPILRFADGQAWTFARRVIPVDGRAVTQITAVDTTLLDDLHLRLQEDNAALAEMGRQLRRYIQDVAEVKAREERLATKMRIHDEVGYALLATRRLLEQHRLGAQTDTGELLTLWKRNIAVLRGAAEVEKRAALQSLTDAAAAIGVRLTLTGSLPTDSRAAALILRAAGECLNNAVRHARATALYLVISDAAEVYTAAFSNNGKQPKGEIAEGGGLSALRRRVEDAGGVMEIAHHPRFTLTMSLPKERGE